MTRPSTLFRKRLPEEQVEVHGRKLVPPGFAKELIEHIERLEEEDQAWLDHATADPRTGKRRLLTPYERGWHDALTQWFDYHEGAEERVD